MSENYYICKDDKFFCGFTFRTGTDNWAVLLSQAIAYEKDEALELKERLNRCFYDPKTCTVKSYSELNNTKTESGIVWKFNGTSWMARYCGIDIWANKEEPYGWFLKAKLYGIDSTRWFLNERDIDKALRQAKKLCELTIKS